MDPVGPMEDVGGVDKAVTVAVPGRDAVAHVPVCYPPLLSSVKKYHLAYHTSILSRDYLSENTVT